VHVVIGGWQDADGTVERQVNVWATDVQLDAADELDQLAQR
jgi:hypothetical protein